MTKQSNIEKTLTPGNNMKPTAWEIELPPSTRFRNTILGGCLTLLLAFYSICCVAGNSPRRIVLKDSLSAEQLEQKMLSMSEAGGGVLVLPKNSTVTATVRSI